MNMSFIRKLKQNIDLTTVEWAAKLIGYIVTAGTIIWTILLSITAKNEINLVVWIEKETSVYPSESSWNKSLPLEINHLSRIQVKSANLYAIKVSNYGRTTIGRQDSTWTLFIDAPFSSAIKVMDWTKQPEGLIAALLPQAKSNGLIIKVGALEPRASISFTAMIVNIDEDKYPRFKIKLSLAGLPHELVTRSPTESLFEELALPVMISFFLVLILTGGQSTWVHAKSKYSGGKFYLNLLINLIGYLLLAAFVGVYLAKGIAYVMSWFL